VSAGGLAVPKYGLYPVLAADESPVLAADESPVLAADESAPLYEKWRCTST
jgi:hypothetical protein